MAALSDYTPVLWVSQFLPLFFGPFFDANISYFPHLHLLSDGLFFFGLA